MTAELNRAATGPIRMDSRKFLGALNDSVQAKTVFFEGRVAEMGKAIGADWRLASLKLKSVSRDGLYAGELFIEDRTAGSYLLAEVRREKGGRVAVENVRPVEVVEERRSAMFESSCRSLIDALEVNDQRKMAQAFDKLSAQRFTSRIIPESGHVRTRDGVTRRVTVSGDRDLKHKARLVGAIVEALRDRVTVERGSVTGAVFGDGGKLRLPLSKWASRRLVARNMREAAEKAYLSPGFQKLVGTLSRLVYEDRVEEAVKRASAFLSEHEEFTLLGIERMQTLVENTLAAGANFNQQLCADVAKLFYRTNLKVNRDTILREWRRVAVKAEHPVLLENVDKVSAARNFEAAYDKFLEAIFEAISNREVSAESLATTLQALRERTPKIRESHDLASRLDDLVGRLRAKDFDDNAIYEAEDLIATIQEELNANDSLGDFDAMPGDAPPGGPGGDPGGDAGPLPDLGGDLGGGGSAPTININSPLIQIGGTSAAGAGGGAPDLEEPPEPEMGGEGDDIDALLAGPTAGQPAPGAPPAPGGAPPAPATPGVPPTPNLGESRRRRGKPIAEEWEKPWLKKDGEDEDEKKDKDSDDPYGDCDGGECDASPMNELHDYGAPPIAERADVIRALGVMQRLVSERGLTGRGLEQHATALAEASLRAIGYRLPPAKMARAVDHLVERFMAEDQHKSPRHKARGFGRTAIHQAKPPMSGRSETVSETVQFQEAADGALLGECAGVPFALVLDGEPLVVSEDRQVEVPVPARLVQSANAAAGLIAGNSKPFLNWLRENVEQLRPDDDMADDELDRTVASIVANPDGSISVDVGPEVNVTQDGQPVGEGEAMTGDVGPMDDFDDEGEGSGPGSDGPMDKGPGPDGPTFGGDGQDVIVDAEPGGSGDDEDIDMSPVSTIEPGAGRSEEDDNEMPDFERDELAEDDDITQPQSSKYTAEVKGDLREMPTPKVPKKSDDKLEDIGPEYDEDDGTYDSPKTAKPMSKS